MIAYYGIVMWGRNIRIAHFILMQRHYLSTLNSWARLRKPYPSRSVHMNVRILNRWLIKLFPLKYCSCICFLISILGFLLCPWLKVVSFWYSLELMTESVGDTLFVPLRLLFSLRLFSMIFLFRVQNLNHFTISFVSLFLILVGKQ